MLAIKADADFYEGSEPETMGDDEQIVMLSISIDGLPKIY